MFFRLSCVWNLNAYSHVCCKLLQSGVARGWRDQLFALPRKGQITQIGQLSTDHAMPQIYTSISISVLYWPPVTACWTFVQSTGVLSEIIRWCQIYFGHYPFWMTESHPSKAINLYFGKYVCNNMFEVIDVSPLADRVGVAD